MRTETPRLEIDGAVGVFAVATTLLAVGVVAVFSAGATAGLGDDGALFSARTFAKQAVFAAVGFGVMLGVAMVPHRVYGLKRLLFPLLLLTAALLVAVLVPGVSSARQGAKRWLSIGGGLSFQPSELAKVALVMALAWWSARRTKSGEPVLRRPLLGLLPALIVVGFFVGIVGIEDFGTGALLALVAGLMLLAAGARWWHLGLAALPGAVALAGLLIAKPYRMQRIRAFLDPWADPQGDGYHVIQSLCGIASGGWWGQGLGLGVQKHGYLPAAHNDFIFAVICEELGAAGGLAIIGLYVAFVYLGARTSLRAPDAFGRLLAFGLTMTIALQAAINVAVVTGCAPAKGISLPLVSAGGSGVLFIAAAVGIIGSVARNAADPHPE